MNDAVLFRSSQFSLEPPVSESGHSYDLPLGDDFAEWLASRIPGAEPQARVSSITREDFGTVFDVVLGDDTFTLTVCWAPSGEHEDRWGIQFARSRGVLRALFGGRPDPQSRRFSRQIPRPSLMLSGSPNPIMSGALDYYRHAL